MVSPASEDMPPPPSRSSTMSKPPAPSGVDTAASTDMSEDDLHHHASPAMFHGQPPPSPTGSGHSASEDLEGDGDGDGSNAGTNVPVQKRRRVTRACDECRRKKIKCDGKQPCTHCSVYSYECTYDKPSNRRRNPAPQYIEALESRLQRAENLLRKFMPDVDLSDPNLDPAVQQEFRSREFARAQAKLRQEQGLSPGKDDTQLLSMIESMGQLDLDDEGGWDFYGLSSGAVFLRRMKENFQGLMGPSTQQPFLPRKTQIPGMISSDSNASTTGSSPWDSASPHAPELPPKELARKLCYYSLNCATCLIRIVHIPTFNEMFERVYEKPFEYLTHEEQRFVGLLFAVMAVGCMYHNLDDSNPPTAYRQSVDQGVKFYESARHVLQDITECRDLVSLQALLFLTLFLQATSNLSGCYLFVGIALRSALRMGLHRHLKHKQIGVIEEQVRRRVFYVVRQMDIYVSAMLGFPLLLHTEDMDQPYPAEVDDEYITNEGILQPPPGTISFFEAFNAHTKLMEILARIIKFVYPLKTSGSGNATIEPVDLEYHISHASIKRIEGELQQWYMELPSQWRPSQDGPVEVLRVRHLLRFAYAHVQLVLYRPFLHYVSPRLSAGKNVDEMSYACAAAAISVSRNIVHIGIEIRRQGVLAGPYWFMLYTEFFAVLSLVFYTVENPEKPGSGDVLADAKAGRDMIEELKSKSQAAEKIAGALDVLFDQLPGRLQQAKTRPIPTKKRSAPSPNTASSMPMQGGPKGFHPNFSSQRRSEELARPSSSSQVNGSLNATPVRSSFDSVMPIPGSAYRDAFPPGMQEMLPLDVASQATSDSGASSHPRAHGFPPAHPLQTGSPIHKLDALMFPSDDPFAYPNQPSRELGFSRADPVTTGAGSGPGSSAVSGPLDASHFSMPGSFDDLEPQQFLSQSAPFFMQQQQQQQQPQQHHPHHHQHQHQHQRHQHHQQQQQTPTTSQHLPPGLDLSNMYQNSTLLGMSEDAQRLEQARCAAQMQRPTDNRDFERMLAESGYQGNWGNMFSRGGY